MDVILCLTLPASIFISLVLNIKINKCIYLFLLTKEQSFCWKPRRCINYVFLLHLKRKQKTKQKNTHTFQIFMYN